MVFKNTRVFALSIALTVSACSTSPKVAENVAPPQTLENQLSKASAAQKAGQSDKAIVQLKAAASAFPVDKQPWAHMAQINFDAGNYGEAINNAQEVLQRDPSDKFASSIIAVSGLRLSTKALSDLSKQNNLSGNVRTEAQELAKLLRDSLGESVLVPIPVPTPPKSKTYVSKKKLSPDAQVKSESNAVVSTVTSAAQVSTVGATPAGPSQKMPVSAPKTRSAEPAKAGANPFGSLK